MVDLFQMSVISEDESRYVFEISYFCPRILSLVSGYDLEISTPRAIHFRALHRCADGLLHSNCGSRNVDVQI
jgi:hypothetical protein